jgi:hypothetical protein
MIKNTVCYSSMPITLQAGLGLHENVGCAVRTETAQHTEDSRCARRTLRSLRPSYCYASRSIVALTNTNPAPASVIGPGACAVESIPTAKAPQRPIFLFFFVA